MIAPVSAAAPVRARADFPIAAAIAAFIAPIGPAAAQGGPAAAQGGPAAASPPCSEEVYRAFDFWLGEWTVTAGPQNAEAGVNRITAEENGCLIVERWTSAQGGTGQSYNYYDPGLKKWRQIWVSPGLTIDYAGGLNDKGEMTLEGVANYHSGLSAPFRGVWTPNADGTVTQHFDQYDAKTGAWTVWFEGRYTPRSRPERAD